jgi:predicted HTH transcriptional regulator
MLPSDIEPRFKPNYAYIRDNTRPFAHDGTAMIAEEGQTVEHKQSLGEHREIVETCAAFATAQGGRIYIGVRDNGQVVGVQIGKGTLEGLANDIAQNTVPKLVPAIQSIQESGQTVVVVEVSENPVKPVTAMGRAYPSSWVHFQPVRPTGNGFRFRPGQAGRSR